MFIIRTSTAGFQDGAFIETAFQTYCETFQTSAVVIEDYSINMTYYQFPGTLDKNIRSLVKRLREKFPRATLNIFVELEEKQDG